MLGAIIGDIVGSPYEFAAYGKKGEAWKSTEFELFTDECKTTDDSICTVAVANKLVHGGTYEERLVELCTRFVDKGYGGKFAEWVNDPDRKPYNSWGNGAAMRVSPVGWWCQTLDDVLLEARASCECTHNHEESYKAAQAVAGAIFLLRTGASKADVKQWVTTTFGYDLDRKLDDIRPTYKFEVSCRKSVPESIICFLEANSFEETLRLAVSLGGDKDTMAAIAGSIAEAHFEIPTTLLVEASRFIEPELLQIWTDFAGVIAGRAS